MSANELSESQTDVNELLKEPDQTKSYLLEIVEKYVSRSQNTLDGTLHPGLDASSSLVRFDAERHTFVANVPENDNTDLEKFSNEAQAEEEQFIQALKEYEMTAKDKYKTGINVDDVHTMQQVWDVVDQAMQKYQNDDDKRLWGRIRGAFRKLGEHEKAIDGWLGLLPKESHYLSVLCGGLKLILTAAARMRKVNEEIFEALQEIPSILNGAQRVLRVYRDSEKLQTYSSALYASVLKAMGHMLGYLRVKSLRKASKAFLAQSSFELKLSEKIVEIRRCRDAFNGEATVCSTEMLNKVQQVLSSVNKTSESVLQEIVSIEKFLGFAFQEQLRTQAEIRTGLKALEERDRELKRRQSELRQKLDAQTATLNSVMQLLKASPKGVEEAYIGRRRLDAPHSSNSLQLTFSNSKKVKQARRILLSRLDYDDEATRQDVVTNYALAATLCREDQERCLYAIKSAVLASWVQVPVPAVLLINGNSTKVQRRSALSFVCAKLVYSLDQLRSTSTSKESIFALHFFCGENVDRDGTNTPCGVVNSLLAQLLTACKRTDLSNVVKLGDFDSDDPGAVYERFECTLDELPETAVVFCIVDGLSFYVDDEKTSRDAERLFRWLVRLTRRRPKGRKGKKGCIFKLLITAPIRLHVWEVERLGGDEVLEVPRRLPNGGGFTEMKWELGIGRQLEELA
ncbi:hypothetical protein BDY21DRAFT_373792 [Lineolata rhizophorae]|uniref:DUF7708 domain-containing protein n=1 Tax=Lineolata rhizophorae TaxID=578093 RepID=A0A6A6NT26_9PEZI|nr:hypothetical protein BDY21DRAFT_373792 [Lineolata rhizophorae]